MKVNSTDIIGGLLIGMVVVAIYTLAAANHVILQCLISAVLFYAIGRAMRNPK